MCAQRTLKHVRATNTKVCILGAFHGRFLHRSERRASDRCEQRIIDIRSVVTATEIMLPNARATRCGSLPIDWVTEEHKHHANLTWNLRLERFGIRTPHIPFLEHGTPITGFHFVSACKDFGHEKKPFDLQQKKLPGWFRSN